MCYVFCSVSFPQRIWTSSRPQLERLPLQLRPQSFKHWEMKTSCEEKWEEQGLLATAMENHGKSLYLSLSGSMAKTQQLLPAGLRTAFRNVLQMPHPAKRPVKSGRRRCLSERVVSRLRLSCNSCSLLPLPEPYSRPLENQLKADMMEDVKGTEHTTNTGKEQVQHLTNSTSLREPQGKEMVLLPWSEVSSDKWHLSNWTQTVHFLALNVWLEKATVYN